MDKILALEPNVVMMDIKMPNKNGLQVAKEILLQNPEIKIIIMTSYPNEILITEALQAGTMACLTKDTEKEELVRAIRSAVIGQRYLNPSIAKMASLNTNRNQHSIFKSLSPQEMEVTMRIAKGIKTKDIAQQLNIKTKTVNSVRRRIFKILNITNNSHLTLMAIQHGIIKINEN